MRDEAIGWLGIPRSRHGPFEPAGRDGRV
jgi:hypothetical protein